MWDDTLEIKREIKLTPASLLLLLPWPLTNVCSQLLGGVWGHLRDLEDHITIGLHGGSGNGAQPVVSHVVQLRKFIP